ncbi:MAG: hypothetical protein JHC26_04380 [Thermofilum sp.]|jgi:hypothetical protein|uniref:hypothetical protein n=1 Tax=Thermofilum sp. TaxID=1961369 RepID=UPI00258BB48E|nr:hypothetical protein [Thermofilum sp.]MCI4408304.1 hypothetical protein [Thermofilum sp.]
MRLTIWLEKQKDGNVRYCLAGYRFFAVADKLYINDKLAKLDFGTKLIIEAYEISIEKTKSERYNVGSKDYVAETISLYTLPYLLIDGLIEALQDAIVKTKEVRE